MEEAIRFFRNALEVDPNPSDGDFPTRADAHYNLGLALSRLNQDQDAVMQYREALREKPHYVAALNNLAWSLSTNPDVAIRNGAEAVQLAERACELTEYRESIMVGTLGAAYAEAGRFEEAIRAAQKAEAMAKVQGDERLAQKNHALGELYASRRSYREPQPSKMPAAPRPERP